MAARCTHTCSSPHGVGSPGVPSPAQHARCVVARVRAHGERVANTIFHGGCQYTEVEWKEALASRKFKQAPDVSGEEVIPTGEVATIRSLLAFDGAAPELINGRLAMVGFFAALGAEIASGEGVIMQLNDAPGAILVTYSIVAAASLIHLFKEDQPEAHGVGPFTAAAELFNGRAAMIGLVFLTFAEHFTGELHPLRSEDVE